MDKVTAKAILHDSYRAYEILFNLMPDYVPSEVAKDDSDLEAVMHKKIFECAHCIMDNIQKTLFEAYPGLKEEFVKEMDLKYSNVNPE
jgi:hypothetical protein